MADDDAAPGRKANVDRHCGALSCLIRHTRPVSLQKRHGGLMPRAKKPTGAEGPPRPLATAQQIAEYLGVPVGSAYAGCSRGGGPRMSRVCRDLRSKWVDLDAYLDANRVDQTGADVA